MSTQYVALPIKVPKEFSDAERYNVDCLRSRPKGKAIARVMVVLDHVPTEDLRSGRLLSGAHGATLARVLQFTSKNHNTKYSLEDFDMLFVNWNCWKTYTMSDQRREDSDALFCTRIQSLVEEYGADIVVTCGPAPFRHLAPKCIELSKGDPIGWLGNAIPLTINDRKVKLVPNMSLNSLLNPKSIGSTAYLLGYFGRCFAPVFNGGAMPYRIPKITTGSKRNFNIIVPKTKSEFDAMMRIMRKAKRVAVDTEDTSLNRINVTMLTIQLCADGKNAYVLPFMHNDSPFDGKLLTYVSNKLRDFFEFDNNNEYHVYVNAKFDMNILRNCIGVRSFKNKVWDIIAGEFALDENLKLVYALTGFWYYRLANFAMQYGCRAYLTAEFGKENRTIIKDVPLDDKVCEYGALDVVIPWHIVDQQIARARDIGYAKYESIVTEQISDQIHSLSTLEHTGAATDVDYLFSLSYPDSPINTYLYNAADEFKNLPEVVKANRLLCKRNQVPESGLFGAVEGRIFKLSIREHVQTLFFDVMKLEPLTVSENKIRANGKPEAKVDKAFQDKHKDNPVMKLYTRLAKISKLRNAYVKSLIRMFGEDDDFRTTRRLRPNYNFDKIVTGRVSANNPNLQQTPSRGELAKYIKRLLISSRGYVVFKVDYSAHEVRGWSIISGDKDVAAVFEKGAELRRRYRLVPDAYISKRLEYEGDVHKMNASYFFGIPIFQIVKSVRDAVKTVIFGLIYQQGDEGLARSTGRKVEEISDIKGKFLDRFPVGLKWFDSIKNFARKHCYVESPLGRRRNLFAFLLDPTLQGAKGTISRSERQSVNSPVQGLGSDFMMAAIRLMERKRYEYFLETGEWPDIRFCISVHDSLSVEASYDWFWYATKLIEECMTIGAVHVFEERHDMKLTSVPEVDFEIGGAESVVSSWDWSFDNALQLLRSSLEFKRDELKDKTLTDKEIDRICDSVRHDQWEHMPEWLQHQIAASGTKLRSMPKGYTLPMDVARKAKKFLAEVEPNKKLLAKIVAQETAAKKAA